jgi:acetyltransferase-like isoleucine patch superfamily enzyme
MNPIPNLLLFEDHQVEHFYPLARLHAFFDLQYGKQTPLQKAVKYFPQSNVNLHCRGVLKNLVRERHPGILVNTINASMSCLMLNARAVLTPELVLLFKLSAANQVWIDDTGEIVAMHLNHSGISAIQLHLNQGPLKPEVVTPLLQPLATIKKVECQLIRNYWEMLDQQTQRLRHDFADSLDGGNIQSALHPGCELIDPEQIAIGANCQIAAHTILDASAGPIWIGAGVKVLPFTWIQGPAMIGAHTVLEKASIQNCIIGAHNRISGIVKDSWTLESVEIAHLALVEKSLVGTFVRIGEQSVLKAQREDLAEITLPFQKVQVNTHSNSFGAFVSDYAMIAAQKIIPAGTVIDSFTRLPWNDFEKYLLALYENHAQKLTDSTKEILKALR